MNPFIRGVVGEKEKEGHSRIQGRPVGEKRGGINNTCVQSNTETPGKVVVGNRCEDL